MTNLQTVPAELPANSEGSPMAMTTVVNVRYDAYDEYVGRAVPHKGLRASPYANPFRVGRDGDHETVTRRFLVWMLYSDDERARWIFAHVHELRGKRIGCWCAPPGGVTAADKPWRCHAQVLAALADGEREAVLAWLADGAEKGD